VARAASAAQSLTSLCSSAAASASSTRASASSATTRVLGHRRPARRRESLLAGIETRYRTVRVASDAACRRARGRTRPGTAPPLMKHRGSADGRVQPRATPCRAIDGVLEQALRRAGARRHPVEAGLVQHFRSRCVRLVLRGRRASRTSTRPEPSRTSSRAAVTWAWCQSRWPPRYNRYRLKVAALG
jgi:hypothetical protein